MKFFARYHNYGSALQPLMPPPHDCPICFTWPFFFLSELDADKRIQAKCIILMKRSKDQPNFSFAKKMASKCIICLKLSQHLTYPRTKLITEGVQLLIYLGASELISLLATQLFYKEHGFPKKELTSILIILFLCLRIVQSHFVHYVTSCLYIPGF